MTCIPEDVVDATQGRPIYLERSNLDAIARTSEFTRDDLIEAIAIMATCMQIDIKNLACSPGPRASRQQLLDTLDALRHYRTEIDTITL